MNENIVTQNFLTKNLQTKLMQITVPSMICSILPKSTFLSSRMCAIQTKITVLPQNLAMARFYFKAGAVTIRGWHLQRLTRMCAYRPLMICLFVCTCNAHAHTYIAGDPLPRSKISRAVFIGMSMQKHAVRFQGQWDFEEIWYIKYQHINVVCINIKFRMVAVTFIL